MHLTVGSVRILVHRKPRRTRNQAKTHSSHLHIILHRGRCINKLWFWLLSTTNEQWWKDNRNVINQNYLEGETCWIRENHRLQHLTLSPKVSKHPLRGSQRAQSSDQTLPLRNNSLAEFVSFLQAVYWSSLPFFQLLLVLEKWNQICSISGRE